MLIIGRDQGHRLSFVLGACGSSDAVHIVFRVVRHIEIDDQRHVRHVNASRDDIGSHQDRNLSVPEIQHHLVSFVLLEVAMHRARVNR